MSKASEFRKNWSSDLPPVSKQRERGSKKNLKGDERGDRYEQAKQLRGKGLSLFSKTHRTE